MRVGFIGLGKLGKGMATNLVKEGHSVTVHNRSQGKVQDMVALGAKAGTSPAGVAAEAEIVFTCLPDVPTVEEIVSGPSGILDGAKEGLIIVDHSTIDPATARKLAGLADANACRFIDAPVSVLADVSDSSRVNIMAGGDKAAVEQAMPALLAIGKNVHYMGPSGSGSISKMLNNMLMGINGAAGMECMVLAAKMGLDLSSLYEVIRNSSGNSSYWERNMPFILDRKFREQGSIRGLNKTLGLVHNEAESVDLTLPILEATRAFWRRALDAGFGANDPCVGIRVLEQDAGIEASRVGAKPSGG